MTTSESPDTFTPASAETDPASAPTSSMIFGAGQALWLAVVTVIAVLALIVALLALWTGGGEEVVAGGGSTEPVVSAQDFFFDPADLDLPAGQEVTVELVNDGEVEHNWSVLSEPIADESEFEESMVIAGVETTDAGDTGTAAVTLDAGEYQVICTISGHFEAGMEGTVTVG